MAEIAPIERTSVSRRRTAKPATVSASALADHLDCSRTYVSKLEAEGVIHRQGDGFQLGITVTVHLICRWRSNRMHFHCILNPASVTNRN